MNDTAPNETANAPLNVSDLRVQRGARQVIHGISLDVPPAEITALLGPNGAGKSSLVLALGGVIPVTGGSIRVGDTETTGRRPDRIRRAGMAIVPEGRRLLGDLTIAENLRVACYALDKASAEAGIAYALELFPELEKRWDTTCRSLSGGEQQMVVLAQAIVSRPRVLVVDELSLGLAPIVVSRLMPTLATVAAQGTSVLLIEQFAHVALSLATSAYVMEGGRIKYSGTAEELQARPELLANAYLRTGA